MKTLFISAFALLLSFTSFAQCEYMKDYNALIATIGKGTAAGQSIQMNCVSGTNEFTSFTINHQSPWNANLTLRIYNGKSASASDLRYTQTNINIPASGNNTKYTIQLGGGQGDLTFEGGQTYTFTLETTTTHFRWNGDRSGGSAISPGMAYWPNNGGTWAPDFDYFYQVGSKPASKNMLSAGETLKAGEKLMSANGAYILRMQEGDGNLCIYKFANGKQGGFVWGSMKYGFKNARLVMQTDGNLVVYDGSNAAKWSSQTHPYYDAKYKNTYYKPVKAVLENDGKLKLYNASGVAVWSSN